MGGLKLFLDRMRGGRVVAVVLVTLLTLVLAGGVIATTTPVGCGAANKMNLTLARCATQNTGLHLLSPTPTPRPFPSAKGGYTPPTVTPPSLFPPTSATVTTYPPLGPPVTYYPPNGGGASGFPPQEPFYGPGSSGGAAPALACKLPVFAGPPGSGGFISFPQGSFTSDPRSAVVLPSPGAPQFPQGGPGGPGGNGMAYDHQHSRWVPVRPDQVAPDGLHYAYASTTSIYVVDPSNNSEVDLGRGHARYVLRVLNDTVYATIQGAPGLWSVPFSGTPRQVTTVGYWQAAAAYAAFGTETSAVPQGATVKLVKLDLASGAVSDWFSLDTVSSSVIGFDSSADPIVQSYFPNGQWVIWVTKSPTNRVPIMNSMEGLYVQSGPYADSHGTWFPVYLQYAQSQGFVLYVAGSGLYWMASIGGSPAGVCL